MSAMSAMSAMTQPTHFHTTEFTHTFQQIVNTYGVPSYKELNPAFFTSVTFPFLFGVMFGDIGHGLLLLTAASALCLLPPSLSTTDIYKHRYLLLLMGLFSTFCGLIYNDFLSIPLNIFGSCYNFETGHRLTPQCTYPVGVDPAWYLSV